MSYAYNPFTDNLDLKGSGGGVLPPDVPTSFVTGDGSTAIPATNILNVLGGPLPDPAVINDNDDGIDTYADPDNGNNLFVFLTNRKVATDSVTGAGVTDLFTQDLGATPGTYNFQVYATGFEPTNPAGCAFTIFGSVRTTGAAATLIVQQDIISDREAPLLAATFNIVVSGNNIIGRATGVAGLTINFKVLANYIFIG